MATPSPSAQLDATLAILQGGLRKITDADHADLAGWVKALHGNHDLADVAKELQKLQDAIKQNHHGTIADSLSQLSELTKHAATKATPDTQSRLYQLANDLKMAAGQVGA